MVEILSPKLKSIQNKWERLHEFCELVNAPEKPSAVRARFQRKLTPQEEIFLENIMPFFLHDPDAHAYMMAKVKDAPPDIQDPPKQTTILSPIPPYLIEDNTLLPPTPPSPAITEPNVELSQLHVAILEGFSIENGKKTLIPLDDIKRTNQWLARQQHQAKNSIEDPENTPQIMFLKFFLYICDVEAATAIKCKKYDKYIWWLIHMNPNVFLKQVKDGQKFPLYALTQDEFGSLASSLSALTHTRKRRPTGDLQRSC